MNTRSPNELSRRCWLMVILLTLVSSSLGFAGEHATESRDAQTGQITIIDQNGRIVPSGAPSAQSQIFDVTVGPGLAFDPNSVNISVGDTVRWTWAGSGHSVTSGNPCTPDSQFCSPNDMNCSAGILSSLGTIYQHTFSQPGSYSYFCAAHCAFGMTGTVTVAVPALQLTSAVSRKTHGAAGAFDINLPLTGTPGVECRTATSGNYSIVATFTNNVVSGTATVTSGVGTVSGSPTFSGQTMTINLTGVGNVQTLTVTLSGVMDQFSQVLPDTGVNMSVLIGDTSGNRAVNASDVAQTKAQIGQSVSGTNFRSDVNANGAINGTDAAIVKSHSGESLPP